MKKVIKLITNNLKIIVVSIIVALVTGIAVYAATANSSDVWYDKSTSSAYGATKNDVQGAITELYQKAYECNNKTCPTTDCPACEPAFKHYGKYLDDATYEYYACKSSSECGLGVASSCTNGISESPCVGNFKEKSWRRLSYTHKTLGKYYTYFKVKLPDNIKPYFYVLSVDLAGGFMGSNGSEMNAFKLYNRDTYLETIHCFDYGRARMKYDASKNPNLLASELTTSNMMYFPSVSSNDAISQGSWASAYCGITSDGYVWIGFESRNGGSSGNAVFSYITRAAPESFALTYDFWYKENQ